MDVRRILALYDQDRRGVSFFNMHREEMAHLVRHISPKGKGLIVYSNLNTTNVDEVIRKQISFFQNVGYDLRWIVYQHDTPANLKDRLLAHGFEAKDPEAVLYLDLKHVSPGLLDPVSFDVRRITDPHHLDDVITIRQQVWQGDYSSMAQSLGKRMRDAPDSLSLYVAYVDGRPVSTAQLSFYQNGHFASLVRAATLPSFRRRGLYTALVTLRIQEARQRGFRFLDAEASPMSRPILEKVGFQLLTEAHPCELRVAHPLPSS